MTSEPLGINGAPWVGVCQSIPAPTDDTVVISICEFPFIRNLEARNSSFDHPTRSGSYLVFSAIAGFDTLDKIKIRTTSSLGCRFRIRLVSARRSCELLDKLLQIGVVRIQSQQLLAVGDGTLGISHFTIEACQRNQDFAVGWKSIVSLTENL